MTRKAPDLHGKTVGMLVVLSKHEHLIKGRSWWWCQCACGTKKLISETCLRGGKRRVKSCGCYRADRAATLNKTHGRTRTPEYVAWQSMKARCRNPTCRMYQRYGGRGIDYCERWEVFENFLEDMGPRPQNGSLERLDNDKGYDRDNCIWASKTEQTRNRSSTNRITYNGVTKPLPEWAEIAGLQYVTLWKRIYRSGWSVAKAIETPTLDGRENLKLRWLDPDQEAEHE